MRIGLIADIHGNNIALEAVLAELDRRQVDSIVCLGDVAMLGPQPSKVLETLEARQIQVVMGNTDPWLFQPLDDEDQRELALWCRAQVGEAAIAFARTFRPSITVPLEGCSTLLACHATPRNFDEVLSATTPLLDLLPMLSGSQADLIAGGHTHIQFVRQFNQQRFINPGSVGLPGVGPTSPDLARNLHVDWAEFAIIESTRQHHAVELHRVTIDLERLRSVAQSVDMPQYAWWSSLWKSS